MTSKRVLRESFRAQLREARETNTLVTEKETRALNDLLIDLLRSLNIDAAHGYWAGFQAIDYEPDVSLAISATREGRRLWAFPRVEDGGLGFYHPSDEGAFLRGGHGIHEPDPTRSVRVALEDLKGLLIPGLVFDLKCNRLGRGSGHYDRALTSRSSSFTPIKIGVAFDRQISSHEIPVEPFDVPMDWVVTETRVLRCGSGGGAAMAAGLNRRSVPERNEL